jgi:hypothetical protein
MMREITNGQLFIEVSASRLVVKVKSILKDIAVDEDPSSRKYPRVVQLHGDSFSLLRGQVTSYAINLVEKEWQELERAIGGNKELRECKCSIFLRFGLPCKHYLHRVYLSGQPIARSLLYPRWWIRGPIVRYKWKPVYPEEEAIDYIRRSALVSSSYTVGQVLETLGPEERARFKAQILRSHENLVKIGEEHRKLGALALSRPDPILRR